MVKFISPEVLERLGYSRVCEITDEEIWETLITPMTKGLLGKILRKDPPKLMETVAGKFPGDEVSNLNNHLLYGGQPGFVRYPYLHTFWKTRHGAVVIKRDRLKFEVLCWYGDVEKNRGELIYKAGLRDRRYDGTVQANDSALLEFPYDDPVLNRLIAPELRSVELSVYGFMPGSKISDGDNDLEFESFIQQPFQFLDRPEKFLELFKRAWKGRRAPGQFGKPIDDISEDVLPAFEQIAQKYGFDMIEAAPSHYHVAKWVLNNGYLFSSAEDKTTFNGFSEGLERIRASGTPLTRQQQSWVCVVQSLKPAELIPQELQLPGLIWPQDNLSKRCLWLYKPISEAAKALKLS